jgi:hypothetical protein
MRTPAPCLILGLLLAQAAAAAAPQVMSAGDLQQLCAGADHVSVNVCRVYILGVAQGIALGLNIADGKTKGARACLPDGVSAEQLEETLKQRLEKNLAVSPAHADQDAALVLASVLANTFPCPKPAR